MGSASLEESSYGSGPASIHQRRRPAQRFNHMYLWKVFWRQESTGNEGNESTGDTGEGCPSPLPLLHPVLLMCDPDQKRPKAFFSRVQASVCGVVRFGDSKILPFSRRNLYCFAVYWSQDPAACPTEQHCAFSLAHDSCVVPSPCPLTVPCLLQSPRREVVFSRAGMSNIYPNFGGVSLTIPQGIGCFVKSFKKKISPKRSLASSPHHGQLLSTMYHKVDTNRWDGWCFVAFIGLYVLPLSPNGDPTPAQGRPWVIRGCPKIVCALFEFLLYTPKFIACRDDILRHQNSDSESVRRSIFSHFMLYGPVKCYASHCEALSRLPRFTSIRFSTAYRAPQGVPYQRRYHLAPFVLSCMEFDCVASWNVHRVMCKTLWASASQGCMSSKQHVRQGFTLPPPHPPLDCPTPCNPPHPMGGTVTWPKKHRKH